MKKKLIAIVLAVAMLATISGVALAEGTGLKAAKATAAVGDISWLEPNEGYTQILDQPIKMAQSKDLFVDVSLLCGLYTQTEVTATSGGGFDTGTAKGLIMVRVSAVDQDGNIIYAYPGKDGVIFAMREQTMWAMLNTDNLSDNMTIGLALETMDAHAYNFIIPNLTSGEYTVVVEAKTESIATTVGKPNPKQGAGDAALASIGYGSVTIEQVRMASNTDIIELPPD